MSNNQQKLSRPPSREMALPHSTLVRRLSVEEAYYLANISRRKSSERIVREDLRLKLGHSNVLEQLLHDIAINEQEVAKQSPPPSPTQSAAKPDRQVPKKQSPAVDEYGFAYDEEDEEDGGSLVLTRTASRRPHQ